MYVVHIPKGNRHSETYKLCGLWEINKTVLQSSWVLEESIWYRVLIHRRKFQFSSKVGYQTVFQYFELNRGLWKKNDGLNSLSFLFLHSTFVFDIPRCTLSIRFCDDASAVIISQSELSSTMCILSLVVRVLTWLYSWMLHAKNKTILLRLPDVVSYMVSEVGFEPTPPFGDQIQIQELHAMYCLGNFSQRSLR